MNESYLSDAAEMTLWVNIWGSWQILSILWISMVWCLSLKCLEWFLDVEVNVSSWEMMIINNTGTQNAEQALCRHILAFYNKNNRLNSVLLNHMIYHFLILHNSKWATDFFIYHAHCSTSLYTVCFIWLLWHQSVWMNLLLYLSIELRMTGLQFIWGWFGHFYIRLWTVTLLSIIKPPTFIYLFNLFNK